MLTQEFKYVAYLTVDTVADFLRLYEKKEVFDIASRILVIQIIVLTMILASFFILMKLFVLCIKIRAVILSVICTSATVCRDKFIYIVSFATKQILLIKNKKLDLEPAFISSECVICYDNEPVIMYCDCKHACVCRECLDKQDAEQMFKCPVCRKTNSAYFYMSKTKNYSFD